MQVRHGEANRVIDCLAAKVVIPFVQFHTRKTIVNHTLGDEENLSRIPVELRNA